MKGKITFLTSIFIIAIMLLTSSVFAAETFTHEGSTYVIEGVNLKLDSLENDVVCLGMDENNNYIIGSLTTEVMYKVNENECVKMTAQEILDFFNYGEYDTHVYEEDLNIYQIKMPMGGWNGEFYFITEDSTADENKTYYELVTTEGESYVSTHFEPTNDLEFVVDKVYYENAFFTTPKIAQIDENISYYIYDNEKNCMTKVENPNVEEIYMYAIMGEATEASEITKIGEITQEAYDKMSMGTEPFYIYYNEVDKEIYIRIEYYELNKTVIYKADGTVVKEFEGLVDISSLGNKFFVVAPYDENWNIDDSKITIIDKEGNIVYESTTLPYLRMINYAEYTTYLRHYYFDVNEFYNIYEYKLLSEDNQKYAGKDLTVKTSGELDRLTSVKVNDVELAETNYTKTSGSTIVTLKNDYLKTLALGTYTLELGYVDGTKIETKFVVDKLYNEEEGTTGNLTGGSAQQDPEDKLDETPKTGNATENSSLGIYITLTILAAGAVILRNK